MNAAELKTQIEAMIAETVAYSSEIGEEWDETAPETHLHLEHQDDVLQELTDALALIAELAVMEQASHRDLDAEQILREEIEELIA